MIYITPPANNDADVGSSSNFIKTTQEDGFVRYTPTTSVSDPYFYIYRNGHVVTGQYMVIKYRLVNNNTSITLSAPFASSAASGQTGAAGKNGDGSNKIVGDKLIADGEWHYFMVTPQEANTTFTANADGTYSWAYFRVKFVSFAAFDGSCYIDIAEVAFADNIYAAESYIAKNETSYPFYVGNLDQTNCSIDGTTDVLEKSIRGMREPIALDLAERTLTTPTSLVLGGWLCTPGGVDCYKIRVTKVNGEAVAEPTLVDFHGGDNRSDIYTAAGKSYGYSDACAIGAGFQAPVDLTAYAGQKVDFEVVGITNYGTEIVFVTVAISMMSFTIGGVHIAFSPLLSCMMLGTIFCNICDFSAELMDRLDRWTAPMFILFFVLSGAELDLLVFSDLMIVLIGVVYIAFRCLGKYFGAGISATISGSPETTRKYLGITLFPQAGVALGMALKAEALGPVGAIVANITLFSVLIYELVGPFLTKVALVKAGEIDEGGITSARIKDHKRDQHNNHPGI